VQLLAVARLAAQCRRRLVSQLADLLQTDSGTNMLVESVVAG
jgi:hypothetical protein